MREDPPIPAGRGDTEGIMPVTNPLGRLNKEVKRRAAAVVGIFPDEPSTFRLIGAVLLERKDERQLRHRYRQLEAMAELLQPGVEDDPLRLPPKAA